MDWFTSLVKMAGASFPVASSFVQLLSDIESDGLQERIRQLEDPISGLHPDIQELSRLLYDAMKTTDSSHFDLSDEMYKKFSRGLACLESTALVEGSHALSKRYYGGISITDPIYIIYMCSLYENPEKMEALYQQIDECPVGTSVDGKEIKKTLGLPLPVIKAAFHIFEAKGYGMCSRTLGSAIYIGKA